MSEPRIIRVDPRHSRANPSHLRFSSVPNAEPKETPTASVPLGKLSDIPNAITAARLVLTLVCLGAMGIGAYCTALVFFLLAAGTDWADGYWARRWGPITKLGRLLDPLADKLLICGAFIDLADISNSRVVPWMAIVVVGRELLVTTLRAMVEGGGGDFSAVMLGKLKMVFQCAAAGLSLLYVSVWNDTLNLPAWVVDSAVWSSVVLTVASGWTYTRSAMAAMREQA